MYLLQYHFLKKNILLVDHLAEEFIVCQCLVYAVILQSATLANLNFKQNFFSELNLSSYFQASYFSGILRISRIADLQHWIFFNFLDILLMLIEEGGVIFPFPE